MDKKIKIISAVSVGLLIAIFAVVFGVGFVTGSGQGATTDEVIATSAPTTDATVPAVEEITLSFIGDCTIAAESGVMEDRNFAWYAENKSHEYFFEGVYDVLSQDDLTFANCECVLSDRDLAKRSKSGTAFWFIAPASYADIFSLGSVEVAGVANNHTYDYQEEGCKDTVASLEAQGVLAGQDCVPLYVETKGVRIGIVYCSLWGSYQTDEIKTALETMQDNCDYKIVYFHGGVEKDHSPANYIIDACRDLANSGLCDLIVGAHPHVLQPMEVVNGVPIAYSIGNFCFGGNRYPENKTAIFQVKLAVSDTDIKTETSFVPCYVYTGDRNNYQPKVITDEKDRQEILRMLSKKVEKRADNTDSTGDSSSGNNREKPKNNTSVQVNPAPVATESQTQPPNADAQSPAETTPKAEPTDAPQATEPAPAE